jgi:GTPase SAR1 family protein
LIPSYIKDADCAFVIYDVGKRSSLFEIDFWVKMFYDNKGPDGFVFIIGNKVDLEIREVTVEEGREKAESLQAPYC